MFATFACANNLLYICYMYKINLYQYVNDNVQTIDILIKDMILSTSICLALFLKTIELGLSVL